MRRLLQVLAGTPGGRLLILAAAPRLALAALIYGTEDVSAWHRCALLMASGNNPYDVPALISWPPLWPAIALASYVTSITTSLPFSFIVKLLPIAADIAIAFVLYEYAGRLTAWAYALNPIAIYTTAVHGNFDSIPALCLLVALITDDGAKAGLWLGIGGAFKTWPLLLLPSLIAPARSARRRIVIVAAAVGVFVIALLAPWPLIGRGAIESIVRYRGYTGWWGISSIAFLTAREIPAQWIFYAAMTAAALLILRYRTPAATGALLLLTTFYVTTPGFGMQYLLWIVPVALIADRRRALVYSGLAGALILFELIARPYTGHPFDSLRLLPHAGFATHYGAAVDHRWTSMARLLLWSFFVYWLAVTLARLRQSPRVRVPLVDDEHRLGRDVSGAADRGTHRVADHVH